MLFLVGMAAATIAGPYTAVKAVEVAGPVMQHHWPDRRISCSDLTARQENGGWTVAQRGALDRPDPGPMVWLNHRLRVLQVAYLGG